MDSFKQYLKNEKLDRLTELEESLFSGFITFIRGAFNKVVNAFKSAFRAIASKLGFGQTITMKISTGLTEANEVGQDSKSRLGYYSEYVCGVELAKLIESRDLKLVIKIKLIICFRIIIHYDYLFTFFCISRF